MDLIYGFGSEDPDKVDKLKVLKSNIGKLMFDAKQSIPHTLMCKREIYNELFILSFENKGDSMVENTTGICISVIDLDTLASENQDPFVKKYTVTYLDEDQSGSDFMKSRKLDYQKLTDIDNPHKIFINSNDTVLVIQSQRWVAIVPLIKDKLYQKPEFEFELQVIDSESVFSRYRSDNCIIEVKFHPLSPYTLCMLLNSNQFKMFDISDSLDNPFFYSWLRPNGGDATRGLYKSISLNDTVVSFDFGTQCALSWQKLTCYFITTDGSIYYLTPLFPLNFGVEDGFIEKLAMNSKNEKASQFLTLIQTRMQKLSLKIWVVNLDSAEYIDFIPELQGPVLIKNCPNKPLNYCGIYSLNVFPQTLVTWSLQGELYIHSTFEEPSLEGAYPLSRSEGQDTEYKLITKEWIELDSESSNNKTFLIPSVLPDRQNKSSFYVLYSKNLCKVEMPWLSMIHRQMKIFRSQNIDQQAEITELTEFIKLSSSPEYNTKISILCEFKESDNGCIGYLPIHSSVFLIQSDPETNQMSLSIVFQKQQTYTEIREYVEDMISKKPLLSQLVDNKQVIDKLKAKMQDFKGLDINRIKLSLKADKLDEKTFLKEFTRLSCDFSANVVKELTEFKADITRRKEIIKELNTMSKNNLEEAKELINVIKNKKQEFKSIYDKVNKKNSEINLKVERIRTLLKDQLPKIVNMPLSRVEEESFKQLTEIEKQVNITKANVDSEIRRFKYNRSHEEAIFKEHKISFSQKDIEESIKPSIEKINQIGEYLKDVRTKLQSYNE